jgi:hypothetical protein
MNLMDRLTSPGPKRILALDGGGIRGALTVGYLVRMEALLRNRHQNPKLKLSEYFDLIGGTSTGSIIAALLAVGKDAAEIQRLYLDLGPKVFGGKKLWGAWKSLFDEEGLEKELQQVFPPTLRLGDQDKIQTGLCIVTKRADTSSTWPLINHPRGKYYPVNKDIPLWEAVRASSAAPVYFVPKRLKIGALQEGAFVDGGVSLANNPALQLFLVAVLKGFPFRWPVGEHKLLMVSLGTGHWERKKAVDDVADSKIWDWAKDLAGLFMDDATWQNQLLLQFLSRSATPWEIDREVGDLSGDLLTPEPALTYLRYNVRLEPGALTDLGFGALAPKAEALQEMSNADNRQVLADIGGAAARRDVRDEHFPDAFNLTT